MKILLKLKHWQLFVITWFIPMTTFILLTKMNELDAIYLSIILIPLAMILFLTGTLGWIWSISIYLNNGLPVDKKLKNSLFKWLFYFVVLFFVITNFILTPFGLFEFYLNARALGLILLTIVVIIFWLAGFAAKTIKSIEIKKTATFPEYVREFFLINLSFIGCWILQPKINRFLKDPRKPDSIINKRN